MRVQFSLSITIILGQFIFLLLCLLSESAWSKDYDTFICMLQNPNTSVQMKGKEGLSYQLKKDILNVDPESFSKDTFIFGHFVSSKNLDLAVGISFPPYEGNLVVLTEQNGRYIPLSSVKGVGFIESMTVVNLMPGFIEQLTLNLYGGGSGLRHWAKDIYCWDETDMRLVWAWIRKEQYNIWGQQRSNGETIGSLIQSEINFDDLDTDGYKEIITLDTLEIGVLNEEVKGYEFKVVESRTETKNVHRWDKDLFYYVPEYGEIISPNIKVDCSKGVPQKKVTENLMVGRIVGIIDIQGFYNSKQFYHAVIGKECFCKIPKSDVKLLNYENRRGRP
jgi:hypothetical protein